MRKSKSISLKGLLSVTFALIIAITGLTIAAVSYIGSRNSGFTMASNIVRVNSLLVLDRVMDYFDAAYKVNRELSYQIESGFIDVKNMESIESIHSHFSRYLNIYPNFVGVYYGDIQGNFIYSKKMPDLSISLKHIKPSEAGIETNWIHEKSNWYLEGYKNRIDPTNLGFDPRKRSWFINAKAEKMNIWTDVYSFSTDNLPGITNAEPVIINGEIKGVLGIDLGIIEISDFLHNLDISRSGRVILLNEEDEVVASSDGKMTLLKALDSQDRVIKEAYNNYIEKSNKDLAVYRIEGRRFLTTFIDFPIESGFKWKVGVILPEKSVLDAVYTADKVIGAVSILLIIISIFIALNISRRITDPILRISSNMVKIREFNLTEEENIDTSLKELMEINRSFSNLKKGMISFSKYVPSRVVARLVSLGREAVLGGEKREITVFFTDIDDFTTISENMDPETLVDDLADYLGDLSKIILSQKGTVDKYIGDSIMAFWNAPDRIDNHAELACEAALKIERKLRLIKEFYPDKTCFSTRIGINTGEVLVGNIGSAERMNYTVMGDNINIGSRLECLNKYYGTDILVSEETAIQASGRFMFRPIDKVCVKGRVNPVMIYELLGYIEEQTYESMAYREMFISGLNMYFDRNWKSCINELKGCLELNPDDNPCKEILERAVEYSHNPPDSNWDGVFMSLSK